MAFIHRVALAAAVHPRSLPAGTRLVRLPTFDDDDEKGVARPAFRSPPLPMTSRSDEGVPMLRDKLFKGRRRPPADLLDKVVRAGKHTVLVIDGDFTQMLNEK